MNSIRYKNRHVCYNSIFFIPLILLINTSCGLAQVVRNQQRIYFISDVQAPLPVEKIILKAYRNEEARDSLFSDGIFQHPENLFILGDLTSRGSKEKAWAPVDTFLNSLNRINTNVYVVPGNQFKFNRSIRINLAVSGLTGNYDGSNGSITGNDLPGI